MAARHLLALVVTCAGLRPQSSPVSRAGARRAAASTADVGGRLEGPAWRRQFTLTDLDDEILLGLIGPQLALVFGALDDDAGPVDFGGGGRFASDEQLAVDFVRGNAWMRDLSPKPLAVASIFGLLPRPLRWTERLAVDLVRVSWPSMLTLDRRPLAVDVGAVFGRATEVPPTSDDRDAALDAQRAWRSIIGPPRRLSKYPRGDAATVTLRSLDVEAESLRFGNLKIAARDVRVEAVDAAGRPLGDLGKALKAALAAGDGETATLHRRFSIREFSLERVDEPGAPPAIALRTPVVAQLSSTKFVANGTDAAVAWSVNVSSAFTLAATAAFVPGRPSPSLPPHPTTLLPRPCAAPSDPAALTVSLGVLPPRTRVRRVAPLEAGPPRTGAARRVLSCVGAVGRCVSAVFRRRKRL